MAENANNILQLFHQQFAEEPQLFFSPGRMNLIGEHIDYNDGFVLPAAINKGIWIAIAPNQSNLIHCIAADINDSLIVDVDNITKQQGWKNYILGVLHVLQQEHKNIRGFHCVFGGNLPHGAGLSSSAAIEAGFLFALNHIFYLQLNLLQMALLAQQAEHSYPGVQCGIMDMYANLFGKKEHAILLDCVSLQHKWVPLLLSQHEIVLINSAVHHSLASGEYNKRRAECKEGLNVLSAVPGYGNSFRNITPQMVKQQQALLPEIIYKRCLYVVEEMERVQLAADYLQQNNIAAFGSLLYQTHHGLQHLYEVSCPEIDYLVQQAKQHKAVIGARLMGGGFGGTVICIIEKQAAQNIVQEIVNNYRQKFNIQAEAYFVQPASGTHWVPINAE